MSLYFEPLDCTSIYTYVEIPHSSELNITDEFTIFARIYVERYGEGLRDILVKAPSTAWQPANFRFGINAGSPALRFVHGDGTVNESWVSSVLKLNTWYDVAVTNDGFYINGEFDNPISITLDWYSNTAPVRVGLCCGGAQRNVFHGIISDVMLFKRKLSQTEINELRKGNVDTNDDSLVLYLPLNHRFGKKAIDYSKYGNHGTIVNARWVCEFQKGLRFHEKRKSYIEVPDDPVLRCDANNQFTVACIANLRKVEGGLLARFLVRKGTDWDKGFGLYYHTGKDEVGCRVCFDAVTRIGTSTPRESGWHMYVGGYDGSKAWIGIDGEWVNSATNTSGLDMMDTTGMPVRIGGNARARNISGEIAAVYMWNRFLSADEIWELYKNPDKPPAKDNLVLWLPLSERYGNLVIDRSGYGNNGKAVSTEWV